MKVLFILLLALIIVSPAASGTAGGDVVHGGWTLESDKDGIKIYTRPVRGSKLKQIRGHHRQVIQRCGSNGNNIREPNYGLDHGSLIQLSAIG